MDNDNPDRLILLKVGDVVRISGDDFMVTRTNESGATLHPNGVKAVSYVTTGGKEVKFDTLGRVQHIAGTIPASMIVERLGEDGLKKNFGQHARKLETTKGTEDMKAKNTKAVAAKPEPRGGLAAQVKATKADAKPAKGAKATKATNGETSKGKLGELFGHSVCAVIRRLGVEGFTVSEAQAAIESQKVKAPAAATISIQLGRGRNKQAPPADLTKEQLATLKSASK